MRAGDKFNYKYMEQLLIYQQLAKINKGIKFIGKDQTNKQQGFKFRGIDDVMNELHSLFAENEVIILPNILDYNVTEKPAKSGGVLFYTRAKIEFCFIASDGSSVKCTMLGEAMDSCDKGANKAESIALKYALLQMFLIPTEEDKDPDSVSPEVGVNNDKKGSPKQEPKKQDPPSASKGKRAVTIDKLLTDEFLQSLHDLEQKKKMEDKTATAFKILESNYILTKDEIKRVCNALGEFEKRTNQVNEPWTESRQ